MLTESTRLEKKVYSCDLRCKPSVELITVVRRFISAFCEQVLDDPDAISRAAMATHELLENAVKYSVDGETSLRIEVAFEAQDTLISIHAQNRSTPDHIAALTRLFEEMQQSANPFVYYQMSMQRSAKRQDGSGLGLARILAEAEMTLHYQIIGEEVHIFAQAQLEVGQTI